MFTKMVHFIPCRGLPSARTTARLFLQHVFRLHGLPDRVVSDRGAQFTARFWKSLMAALKVRVCLSSAHHPETDGGTEKVIGILEQYLRCFVNHQQDNWAEYLPLAEFAFNNSQHTSTRMTPFFANLGYHPRMFPVAFDDSPTPDTQEFLTELTAVQQLVRRQLARAKEDYKRVADRYRKATPPLAVGDRVWLSTKHLPSERQVRKLDHRFVGPYPVEAVINPVAYRLALPRSLRVHPVFHRSLLVPAAPSCPLRRPTPPSRRLGTDDAVDKELDSLRDSRWLKGRFQYLVAWKGHGPEAFTWVDAADVTAPEMVRDFHTRFPSRPHPDRRPRGKGPERGDSVVTPTSRPAPHEEDRPAPHEEDSDEEGPLPGPSATLVPDPTSSQGQQQAGEDILSGPPPESQPSPASPQRPQLDTDLSGDEGAEWVNPIQRRKEKRRRQKSRPNSGI